MARATRTSKSKRSSRRSAANKKTTVRKHRVWRGVTASVLVVLASVLLLLGNVFFWAGRTIVDTNSYKQTSEALIKDQQVQSTIALYTTTKLFENRDVPAAIQRALPPKADFLAQPLADKVQTYTQQTIGKILANQKFQTTWVNVNVKAHDSLLKLANSPAGQDGVINLNDIYQGITTRLKDTKLAFLADKQLPADVGDITVLKSNKLHALHVVSTNITKFKYISLSLVAAFSALAIWLVQRRRRLVVTLGLVYASLMALTLVAARLTSNVIAGKAKPEYHDGVASAANIILHPLALQTWVLLLIAMGMAVIAWATGSTRSAVGLRTRLTLAFNGKLHQSLFKKENKLTKWAGHRKSYLRGASLFIVLAIMLFVQLRPMLVLVYALVLLVLLAIVETLAAPVKRR